MDRHFCCEYALIEIKGANNTDHKFKKLLKYSWNSFKQDFSLQYLLLQNINTRRYSKVLRNYLYIFIKIPYYWGRVIFYKFMVGFLGLFYFYQYILITSVSSCKDSLACCTTGSILMCWAVVSRIRSPGMCGRIYHCTRTRFMGTSCT